MNLPRHHLLPLALLLAATLLGCSKSITSTEILAPSTPQSQDANAGSWKMIVLTGATQIPVVAPVAITDPAYVAELASIKLAQASLTRINKPASRTGAPVERCAGTRSCANWLLARTCHPHPILMAAIPRLVLRIHSQILNFHFRIRPMQRALIVMFRSPSSRH